MNLVSILKINYDQLQQLESLPQKIKNDVIRNSLVTSILNTRTTVSEFSFKNLEKSRLVKFDRKVQKNRITLSKISDGYSFDSIHASLNFSTINESLSSFPWRKTKVRGTDGKMYPSFIAQVLGKLILPMPKTFMSNIRSWSVKRTSNKAYPLKKAFIINSSISDLLRFDKNLLDTIIAKTNSKYESEIQRNMRWGLMKL